MHASILFLMLNSVPAQALTAAMLPAAWHGQWSGRLLVNSGQSIGMHLTISELSPSALGWSMQYEGQPARAYQLQRQSDGILILNEGQGVKLHATYFDSLNTLASHFQVNEQSLVVSYVLETPSQMRFELVNSLARPTAVTAAILSFPLAAYQRAILSKEN